MNYIKINIKRSLIHFIKSGESLKVEFYIKILHLLDFNKHKNLAYFQLPEIIQIYLNIKLY